MSTRSGSTIDAGRRLDDLLDRLHARPDAGEAAHREGVQAHVEDVLHAGREEHRQAAGLEDVVALVRRGASSWRCGRRRRARSRRRACAVPAMLACLKTSEQRSTPGPLPYQMPNTPSNLLAPADRGRAAACPRRAVARELLVDAGLEHDVLRREVLLGLPQRLVVAAERRAAVAADEAGGVQAGACASRCRCSIGSRTSACTPLMKARPWSSAYLSSSVTVSSALRMRLGQRCVHRRDSSGRDVWRASGSWRWRARLSVGTAARQVFSMYAWNAVLRQ